MLSECALKQSGCVSSRAVNPSSSSYCQMLGTGSGGGGVRVMLVGCDPSREGSRVAVLRSWAVHYFSMVRARLMLECFEPSPEGSWAAACCDAPLISLLMPGM